MNKTNNSTPPSKGGAVRVKDAKEHYKQHFSELDPNMQNFLTELHSTTGRALTLTSGRRDGSKVSHHHSGNAVDFKADEYEHYNYLFNTKDGLNLMSKYGLGIIDETDPRMLSKTKGTGAHFHIGKDSSFTKIVNNRKSNSFQFTPSYRELERSGKTQEEIYNSDFLAYNLYDGTHHEGDGHDHSSEEITSLKSLYTPQDFKYEEFQQNTEREIAGAVETETDEDRKALTQANQEENEAISIEEAFLQMASGATNFITEDYRSQNQQTQDDSLYELEVENVGVQPISNIFNL